jgi:hypothetical protein
MIIQLQNLVFEFIPFLIHSHLHFFNKEQTKINEMLCIGCSIFIIFVQLKRLFVSVRFGGSVMVVDGIWEF